MGQNREGVFFSHIVDISTSLSERGRRGAAIGPVLAAQYYAVEDLP